MAKPALSDEVRPPRQGHVSREAQKGNPWGGASLLYCHNRMPNKGRIILYYVLQVAAGTEDRVEEQVRVVVENGLYDSCFHPMRRMKKKFGGEWKEIHEKLLPGYVFITSDCIQELYRELQNVPAFTRMLGKDREQFIPLPEHEVRWLERMIESPGQNMEVQLSRVSVSEDDMVTILSGPLKYMEGCVKKIDLHRRIAKVEVDFMNRKTVVHLGIEMVGKRIDSRKCQTY